MDHGHDLPATVEQAAEALAAIVRSSPEAIFTVALDGTILTWNRGAERLYQIPVDGAIGRTFREIFPRDDAADTAWTVAAIRSGETIENLEVQRTTPSGQVLDLAVTMSPIWGADGEVSAIASIVSNITRLKDAERQVASSLAVLRASRLKDALTGIGSRDRLLEVFNELVDATDLTLMLIDIDEFHYFNQTFGHDTADDVLRVFAAILGDLIEPDELLVRTGGDEFGILSMDRGPDRGSRLAEAIMHALADPVAVGNERHAITVGIGVATASRVLPNIADLLLRRADLALHQAKAAGHGLWRQFDADMESSYAARTQLEERLRHADRDGGELWVAYQPICDPQTGLVSEVEALLRWDEPELGPVSPADFIPVAEECGEIVSLGEWVLREACSQTARWNSLGLDLTVAVNVSPRQLADRGFADAVQRALTESGLDADRLILEITESAIAGSAEILVAELVQLREMGIGLAVDDFGTGHSSLARLHSLPFTVVKIDRSLIDGLGTAGNGDIIVGAVIDMCHALGLAVVAEGVEQPRQLDRLGELGCDLVQGFALHLPMPASEIARLESVQAPCHRA